MHNEAYPYDRSGHQLFRLERYRPRSRVPMFNQCVWTVTYGRNAFAFPAFTVHRRIVRYQLLARRYLALVPRHQPFGPTLPLMIYRKGPFYQQTQWSITNFGRMSNHARAVGVMHCRPRRGGLVGGALVSD